RLWRSAALIGRNDTAARSGTLMKKHNALATRMLARQDDYLRFTRDQRVPFDNNAAEREIRSGCEQPPNIMTGRVARCGPVTVTPLRSPASPNLRSWPGPNGTSRLLSCTPS
ncbi:transposase, partial [Sphaerisporangium sp. NPDC051017]|uniref:IS66 family transposase n=1 Tax=Sphaerisporangium sp. NPDC051017 TaxID=3154636 RepID=UPI003429F61F